MSSEDFEIVQAIGMSSDELELSEEFTDVDEEEKAEEEQEQRGKVYTLEEAEHMGMIF